ncbi:50S ribosomal protein L9 [Candidatus Paracaedibacter symbiosus]|uniref:50S ribosomal protein L9 n=1 Tax=Candidatus Paracaedibacter symbiosus TaxID=244582 RepID=UPI000509FF22|nr:50S ribosomal protein L9 [Candidatus Paracaedibacter symbiosus]
MQVILLERIEKLGQMGQIVMVKPGYARNFLLPKKKAIRATKENLSHFETQRAQLEANNLKRRDEAQYVADKMRGAYISIVRQASEMGHLYGSVRSSDIASGLLNIGFTVTKAQIKLLTPIKTIGAHIANVILHPEVIVEVNVVIAKSAEEAALKIAEEKTKKQKPQQSEEA